MAKLYEDSKKSTSKEVIDGEKKTTISTAENKETISTSGKSNVKFKADDPGSKTYYNPLTGEKVTEENDTAFSSKPSITFVDKGITKSDSLKSVSLTETKGKGTTTDELKIGNLDRSARVKVDSKGVSASGEVSVSAVKVSKSGQYGSDDNNVHASGDVEVLKGKISGSTGIGKYKVVKDGKTVDEIGVGVKGDAGVYLIDATGKAGFTFFGMKINLKGAAHAGAGISGEAALTTGGVALSFGATCGLGADVGVEIDWTEFVLVKKLSESKFLQNLDKKIKHGFEKATNTIDVSDFTIKVEPEVLKAKASEIDTLVQSMEKDWKALERIVKNSHNYWQGEAETVNQKIFKGFAEDMNTLLKRLKEHPEDLLKMAGYYEEAETNALNQSTALAGDVIS